MAAALPDPAAPGLSPAPPFGPRQPPGNRWMLWGLLVALVAALLVTLVWLAGRYEASQVQTQLERDLMAASSDIRTGLARHMQSLQALHATTERCRRAGGPRRTACCVPTARCCASSGAMPTSCPR
jgi:hypothetical protein